MSLASRIDLSQCAAAQLWASLDPEVRLASARLLYAHDWGEAPTRREADFAIIQGMRFRESAVRQLSVDKRAQYLARSIRPTDSLAGSMLLALHLGERRAMLSAFLDALKIPHENGLIAEDHDMKPPSAATLEMAARALHDRFPGDEVELYLATLYVLDRHTWAGFQPLFGKWGQSPFTYKTQ
jgi:hypothetical protein